MEPSELALVSQDHCLHLEHWYSESNNTSTTSAAQDAFDEATKFFSSHLTKEECKRIWLRDKTSITDIESIVQSAKAKYEQAAGKRNIQISLKKLSLRVSYYGAVLDTLAQHHPEYVALAWGTLKLVFIGILNYEELLERIAEALAQIADVLPRTDLSLKLYPTDRMKRTASQLYAYIIKFLQHAVIWYKKRTISRTLSALVKPYELHVKDTVLKIDYYAKAVDDVSTSASRAELRAMHFKIDAVTLKLNEILQMSLSTNSLNQSIRHDLAEQRQMVYCLQLSHVLGFIEVRHRPQDTLRVSQSILQRRRRTNPGIVDYSPHTYQSLNTWANSSESSLLLVQPGARAKAKVKGLATFTINVLQRKDRFVIWSLDSLPAENFAPKELHVVTILKGLVSQALGLTLPGIYKAPGSLNPALFQAAHTSKDWATLLYQILSCNYETFIVIGSQDMGVWEDDEGAQQFLELFEAIVEKNASTSKIKVLIIKHGLSTPVPRAVDSRHIVSILESSTKTRMCPTSRGRNRGRGRGRGRFRDCIIDQGISSNLPSGFDIKSELFSMPSTW